MRLFPLSRRILVLSLAAAIAGGAISVAFGLCGPFTDVTDAGFCPFVLEIFTLGITTGTSPTTYDPTSSVSRLQMAAFLSRTVDGVLRRGSRRAALEQFWTTQAPANLGLTTVSSPHLVKSDGTDIWVASSSSIVRVSGGTGRVLESWSGADGPYGLVVGMGKIFATGFGTPGKLYRIDPSLPAGVVTTVASSLGAHPYTVAYDGSRLWTGNIASVSLVTPTVSIPWTVTTFTTGFSNPGSVLYDGANVWVADIDLSAILRLDSNGAILQTVTVGFGPNNPTFDGTNIWVPNNFSSSVSVVRPSTGAVLATLTGNGLDGPIGAAFDGQRILVSNYSGGSVSLWKAADLTPIGTFQLGVSTSPYPPCSDGVSFWIGLSGPGKLARF